MAQYRTTAHLASRGELRSPANVAIGTVLPGRATGMIRGCIHSLSLGLWPIQLPRRGSLLNLPLSGEVPRRGGEGTEAAIGTVSNNSALTSRGELRSPANVAIGTVLPGEANGMIRWFPRRADDICPYGAEVVFAPVGEAISLPQTLPSARYCRKGQTG